MVYSGLVGQQSFQRYLPPNVPGVLEGMHQYRAMPYMNTAGGRQPVYTITPPATVDANTTYRMTIDGVEVKFLTGGATTTAQLGAGLYNALRTNPVAYRSVDATLNAGTGVITLTGRIINRAVTIVATSNATTTNDLTVANTVAIGTDSVIPFGRFVGYLSSYPSDPITGFRAAALINHASNFTVAGITMKQKLEVVGRYGNAVDGYPTTATMNVLEDTGTNDGIWVEAVESDIVIGDSVYIAIAAGNEGKVSKTSSGNVNISTRATFESGSVLSLGKVLVLVRFKKD